jgi:hypothetical protein
MAGEPISATNLPAGSAISEIFGIESVGLEKTVRRFSRPQLLASLQELQAGGGVIFSSLSQANAALGFNAWQMAWVVADSTPGNNGVYQKNGAANVGSWVRVGNLPYSFFRAVNSGTGSANAIIAANSSPIVAAESLIALNITHTNTSSSVTVKFNNMPPMPIKTASGNDPAIGGLIAGMVVAGYIEAANFRLLSDQASAAIQAAAEAAQAAAEDARDIAVAAAQTTLFAGDLPVYPSVPVVEALSIPSTLDAIFLLGYTAAGDGRGGTFKKVVSAGDFQSADGAWWLRAPDLSNLIVAAQARLTLTSGVAVTQSDVAGATSIYLTPVGGGTIPSWNGSTWLLRPITELTLALNSNSGHTGYHQSGRNFDLFHFVDSGGVDRLGTGPSWNAGAVAGSDSARGTGAGSTEIQWVKGIPTNKNSISIRFGTGSGDVATVAANRATCIGSFRATANGQASDTRARRLLYNAHIQQTRPMFRTDPIGGVSWPYSAATWRQANANAANQLEVLAGFDGVSASARALSLVPNCHRPEQHIFTKPAWFVWWRSRLQHRHHVTASVF